MASSHYGFSRSLRLLEPEQFQAALCQRPLAKGHILTFHWYSPTKTTRSPSGTEHNDVGLPLLGLVIPKRLARLAVQRNAIKRVLRESFRLRQHELHPGFYVFRLKNSLPRMSISQLKRSIREEADKLLLITGRLS